MRIFWDAELGWVFGVSSLKERMKSGLPGAQQQAVWFPGSILATRRSMNPCVGPLFDDGNTCVTMWAVKVRRDRA